MCDKSETAGSWEGEEGTFYRVLYTWAPTVLKGIMCFQNSAPIKGI